jgi:hypothetical protein
VSGILRSVEVEGIEGFAWDRFWGGFRKLLAACITVGLAISGELLLLEGGMEWAPITMAVSGVMGFGFFWSALKNLTHFFPGLQEAVEATLHRTRESD